MNDHYTQMNFVDIINNAGLDPKMYPNSSAKKMYLYDEKMQYFLNELRLLEPLFAKNPGSLQNFKTFLLGFEAEVETNLVSVYFDDEKLVLFYRTPRELVFKRS